MNPPHRLPPAIALLALVVAACGASQAKPTTPQAREVVVEEPTVITASRPLREGELPPLPQELPHTSSAFQRGHALATALLAAPGPGVPSALDDASYGAWSAHEFQAWLTTRVQEAQAATDALGAVRDGPASEHVPAAALLGLVFARTHEQLLAVPAPASVSGDGKLLRIYGSQLNASSARWSEQAIAAFAHCSRASAQEAEPAFGLWLQLCQQQLQRLQRQAQQAQLLADVVAAEREADRLAAEGPRPPGPQICWGPAPSAMSGGELPAEQSGVAAPPSAPPPTTATTPTAVPAAPAAANTPPASTQAGTAPAPSAEPGSSPRDRRYGPRDVATSVRVYAALGDNPTMDASPLIAASTRSALAACFAKSIKPDHAVTVALHANLSVDARGKTRTVNLTPEPSDDAEPPDRTLSRCLQSALQKVAFAPSPSAQPTQATATFCLRRD